MTGVPRAEMEVTYPDTGCPDLGIPRCVSCPLAVCRWDLPPRESARLVRRAQRTVKQAEIRRLLAEGLTVEEAGKQMGISRRSAYRLRARPRE